MQATTNVNLTIAKTDAVATSEATGAKTVAGRLGITVKGEDCVDRA